MEDKALPKLELQSVQDIFRLIDEIKADEIKAAGGVAAARTRIRVKLSSIAKLCKIARRDLLQKGKPMEKYGVETKDDGEKSAAAENVAGDAPNHCPICGKPVETHGTVKKCPEHGSEPFEKDKE